MVDHQMEDRNEDNFKVKSQHCMCKGKSHLGQLEPERKQSVGRCEPRETGRPRTHIMLAIPYPSLRQYEATVRVLSEAFKNITTYRQLADFLYN